MEPGVTDALNKLSDDHFKNNMQSINYLYLDMDTLQDFRIGAIMCLLKTEEEYNHLLEHIVEYNERTENATMKFFPEINITDDEIEAYILDPKNHLKLEHISPMTIYYHKLLEFFNKVDDINTIAICETAPKLYIGCGTVKYSAVGKTKILKCIQELKPIWEMSVTDDDIYDYAMELITIMDHMTVWDFAKLFNYERFKEVMMNGDAIVYASVHAFPFFDYSQPNIRSIPVDQVIENTEIAFGLFCDFKLINLGIAHE